MTSIKIFGSSEDPYLHLVANAAEMAFPGSSRTEPCAVFEAVANEIIGTKQQRYGPYPNPEHLVSIRSVIRLAIARNERIPVLIPWGGSKQGSTGIDVGELFALRQVLSIIERVKAHYPIGMDVRIRIEDLTDHLLFQNVPGYAEKTKTYSAKFARLAQILSDGSITPIRESQLGEFHVFLKEMLKIQPVLEAVRPRVLEQIEWSGTLRDIQIEHYRRIYANFYPALTEKERNAMIARYFAVAKVRRLLNATGFFDSEPVPLVLSFTAPIPGQSVANRVFLRSLPERFQNSHRAPWIGRGYYRIRGSEATPALAGWTGDGHDYTQATMSVAGNEDEVTIASDYVVVD